MGNLWTFTVDTLGVGGVVECAVDEVDNLVHWCEQWALENIDLDEESVQFTMSFRCGGHFIGSVVCTGSESRCGRCWPPCSELLWSVKVVDAGATA